MDHIDAHDMTLRDYFAAKALPDAIRYVRDMSAEDDDTFDWFDIEEPATVDMHMVAKRAYSMADAMLAAREAK
jgi:hypothetical protein